MQFIQIVIFALALAIFDWSHITVIPTKSLYHVSLLKLKDAVIPENNWFLANLASECRQGLYPDTPDYNLICQRSVTLFIAGMFVSNSFC